MGQNIRFPRKPESEIGPGVPAVWKRRAFGGHNQLARWSASALVLHEKKFKRIKGYRQLPKMIAELENLAVDNNKMVA